MEDGVEQTGGKGDTLIDADLNGGVDTAFFQKYRLEIFHKAVYIIRIKKICVNFSQKIVPGRSEKIHKTC